MEISSQLRAVGVALVWAGVMSAQGQVATGQTTGQATGAAQAAASAAKRPMTFADLMAIKRVGDPQISPSGKWVLFSVTDVSLEKNAKVNHLWVVPIGGGHERQVTSNSGESFGRFSPDGKFVSYTGAPSKDDPVSRITIAPWDEATGTIGVGRTLTAVSGDADGAIWSPDSRHFLFTTQVYPECSVKAGAAKASANAGILRSAQNDNRGGSEFAGAEPASWAEEDACNKAKDDAAAASPVKGQVWDSLLYRHWDQYTGLKRTHIIEADFSLDGANPRDVTPASAVGDAETPTWMLGGPLEYAWSADSREIAYVTNIDKVPATSTNNDVFSLRLDEPGAKAVKVSTSPGSDDAPAYSPDGKYLAFRSQARNGFESDRFRLMLFDREKKTIKELTSTWVHPQFDLWVDEFTWDTPSLILFASADKGAEVIRAIQTGGELEQRILSKDGEFSELSTHGDDIVASHMLVNQPTEIVKLVHGQMTQLTHVNDALLSHLDLAKLEPFWFEGAEGTKVQGFIVKPPNFDAAKKYPVKFVMHGGPQTAFGDAWSYRWNAQLMAASGYVVVQINRRGSTGYGQKFVDEVSGDWGGRAYVDLMKGLDYAEAHYPFIDKTRECALGASYGGFMADWILTHNDRFKCIVTHDGMADPVSAYGTTEEMWFNEWEFRRPEDFPAGWDGFAGAGKGEGHIATPWRYQSLPADQDPFRKWSALRSIENAKTPTLIIHSQRDYRLDVSQGFELYTALQRQGVPARFLYFPDEGHWVLKPQNSQLWYQTISDWCDRWTKTNKFAEK